MKGAVDSAAADTQRVTDVCLRWQRHRRGNPRQTLRPEQSLFEGPYLPTQKFRFRRSEIIIQRDSPGRAAWGSLLSYGSRKNRSISLEPLQ
jgi:hypothetical protein